MCVRFQPCFADRCLLSVPWHAPALHVACPLPRFHLFPGRVARAFVRITSMPAAEFSWATAPLNDFRAPAFASAGYVLVVLVLERLMRLRGRGFETKYLQAVHNAILCVLSLTMAVGTAVEVVRRIASSDSDGGVLGSARWVFCEDPRTEVRRHE